MNQTTTSEFHFALLQEGLREYFRMMAERAQQERTFYTRENGGQSVPTRSLELV